MEEQIINNIRQSIAVKEAMLADGLLLQAIEHTVEAVVQTFRRNGKVLFCGNGGSAADAQHLAAELSGRYYLDRKALFAEALHVNTSFLTAAGNDFGFDQVFARAVEAMGKEGDLLVALSTSGNSPNILNAMEKAKSIGMRVAGLTGASGGKMAVLCDFLIKIPSTDTPRIQEGHMLAGHIICALSEKAIFRT